MILDTSMVSKLAFDLVKAGPAALVAAQAVTAKGALNVKTKARELAPKGPHLPHYANSITYDLSTSGMTVEAEIGPDPGLPQGPLDHLFEYGGPKNAPMPHLGPALESEAPVFERFLDDAVGKALRL